MSIKMELKKPGIDSLDLRLAAAVGICILTSWVAAAASISQYYQVMTAAIAVLLCTQDNTKISWKAGTVRLVITMIGGLAGIVVTMLDEAAGNRYLFVLFAMLGLLAVLFGCKLVKVPYINCRIGCVCYVLVLLTRQGTDRISYAAFRLLSTCYGILVVIAVAALFGIIERLRNGACRSL